MATAYNSYVSYGEPVSKFMAGQAHGYPSLDVNSLIDEANIPQLSMSKMPSAVASGLKYMGKWDASTTTPGDYNQGQLVFRLTEMTIAQMGLESPPLQGQFWRVDTASANPYAENITDNGPVDFAVTDFLVIDSVTAGVGPDTYLLTFSKVDNTDTVLGVKLDDDNDPLTGTVDLRAALDKANFKDTFGEREMSVSPDNVPPLTVATFDPAAPPPTTQLICSGNTNIAYLDFIRGDATGDVELLIKQRITVPDNFAAFKLDGGTLTVDLLFNMENDGGNCEATLEEVHGHETVDNRAPTPVSMTSGNDDYSSYAITGINEPLNGGNTLVPGQTFLVVIKLKLSGAGGANQKIGFGGLKFDYMYQV